MQPLRAENDSQLALLWQHRRRLAYRLRQQAQLGHYAPPDVVLDIEDARAEIAALKIQLRAAGTAVADDPTDTLGPGDTPAEVSARAQRNRTRILRKMDDFWIKGLLEHSLHGAALIALGLDERPEAVVHPWDLSLKRDDDMPRRLPPGTPIIDVFDAQDGELLILGAPGAGKTTLLLDLARALLERAQANAYAALPVIFNLSSWADQQLPLDRWLVDELNRQYDVPRTAGEDWINTDAILPLLDGLDEVRPELRGACVLAINAFRKEHGLVNLVICSRITDYAALSVRLKLQGAVLVQPLTARQIDEYLSRAGDQLAALRAAMAQDAGLYEMAETPLMLSVMALAYQGASPGDLLAVQAAETRRRHLFQAYVQRMWRRRGGADQRRYEQAVQRLARLAQGMQRQATSIFFIADIQPTMLPTRPALALYVLIDRLGSALLIGLVLGLSALWAPQVDAALARLFALLGDEFGRILSISMLGITHGANGLLLGLLLGGLFGGNPAPQLGPARASGRWLWNAAAGYLVVALASAVATLIRGGGPASVIPALLIGLSGGLAGALAGAPQLGPRSIAMIERLQWSLRKGIPAGLGGLAGGLLIGAVLGGFFGLRRGLLVGLALGVAGGLLTAVSSGMINRDVGNSASPHLKIRRSLRSAAVMSCTIALIGMIVFTGGILVALALFLGVGQARAYGVANALSISLMFGLVAGLIAGLTYGGYAVLSHAALRLTLWLTSTLPLNLVAFLDDSADRIFLRKVGGGYMFIHRLLLEHFAALEPPQAPPAPGGALEPSRQLGDGS